MNLPIYLPKDVWYNFYSKNKIQSEGSIFTVEAALDTIPIAIRGGYILPVQDPAATTTSRYNHIVYLCNS